MTFLDNKGGSLKEGVSGSKSDAAIRSVRAKREADEAGKSLMGLDNGRKLLTIIRQGV